MEYFVCGILIYSLNSRLIENFKISLMIFDIFTHKFNSQSISLFFTEFQTLNLPLKIFKYFQENVIQKSTPNSFQNEFSHLLCWIFITLTFERHTEKDSQKIQIYEVSEPHERQAKTKVISTIANDFIVEHRQQQERKKT